MTSVTIGNATGLTATVTTQKLVFPIAVNKDVTVKLVNEDSTNSVDWIVKAFHHPVDTTQRLLVVDIPTIGVETVAVSATVIKDDFDDVQVPDDKAYTHLVVEYVRTTVDATPISVLVLGRPSL